MLLDHKSGADHEILYPYLYANEIIAYPIVCTTKRTASEKFRGGVSNYYKVKKELTAICRCHKHELVTTMFDYYAMPSNTPHIDFAEPDIYKRMEAIESAINEDIGENNCRFHFSVHEFEGMLFSKPSVFQVIADEEVVNEIQRVRDTYLTPEHINNSHTTAPSKRLEKLIPNYAKIKNGTIISKETGINILLEQCQHFNKWINLLLCGE